MDHSFDAVTSLDATTSRDDLATTVRIDVLGSLNQTSRPSLVHMIHELRSTGIQSHVSVDLSRAALVESTALAGLRKDLNAMEDTPGTAGGGVSLMLTGETAAQHPGDPVSAGPPEISDVLDAEAAATFQTGSQGVSEPSFVALPAVPLMEYSDDELFAASDAVFSLLDDPGTVGGSDLLGRYNDIGQEIVRRFPLSGLSDSAREQQATS
ncbi:MULTISPECIES: hypothetical protein [unclassified Arthrobacter]|uniref:hypothetical protein n=1 Tax=unclassified Arthrobacter TaxID=235627 RepID=UPI0033988AC1